MSPYNFNESIITAGRGLDYKQVIEGAYKKALINIHIS